MSATHVGPIDAGQLNNTFFVWGNGVGFNTIQEAVTYVRNNAGAFPGEIVVVHGHGYGEDISSITGGSLGIPIVDQRDERNQRYYWDDTQSKYVPKPFEQRSGFIAHGIPQILDGGVQYRGGLLIGYDPTGTSGAGTATLNVAGEPGAAAPTIELAVQQNGSASHVLLHSDDQTINLYPLSGNVFVNGSLIRTAANSPYPPVGIPQSTGSAWGASINPATLQGKLTVTTTGTSGPSTLVGNTLNIPQYAGTSGGMVYPDAGIGVSTGTAWGTSIDPATIPSLTAPLNQFSGDITGGGNCTGANTFPVLNQGNLKITWNISNGGGETDFLNCNGGAGGGFRWYSGASGAAVTSTTPSLMYLHASSGKLDVPGGIAVGAAATGLLEVASGNTRLTAIGANATAAGAIVIHGSSSNSSRDVSYIQCYDDGTYQTLVTGNFTVISGNLDAEAVTASTLNAFNPAGGGALLLLGQGPDVTNPVQLFMGVNPTGGAGGFGVGEIQCLHQGVTFCDLAIQTGGGNTNIGSASGTITAFGTFNASGTKNFRIKHPTKADHWLFHSCLEGPEAGVYYRGEGTTNVKGLATVELPDYFEKLTRPDGRSVLLTAINDDSNETPVMTASRVKDGKFSVHSSLPGIDFWWEVKAIRADVKPLAIDRELTEDERKEAA